jgi:ADP-heptose:LPS heptosyltransferase
MGKAVKKLVFRNSLSPGDIVVLTAAVRDLHRAYPGGFVTDVRTEYPELWAYNPYITPLDDSDPEISSVECHYPLIHKSNTVPCHFLHGFIEHLNEHLDLNICPTAFKGDLYLEDTERTPPRLPIEQPYWLIVAGGKFDYTIKWWASERFQQVVDYFIGKIRFVQIGLLEHHHPPLRGAIDMRGRTTLRDLIQLVHHAQGVLCPVTLAMHLAAAVEMPSGETALRPCVVVAGGREPMHWVAYPGHQVLHTIGALQCCSTGGCWQSRTVPLGDGDKKDSVYKRCHHVVGTLPKCMDMITATHVIRAIETYFEGGKCQYA